MKHKPLLLAALFGTLATGAQAACVADAASFPAGTHPSLTATNACWDAASGTLHLQRSLTFRTPGDADPNPDHDLEGFNWTVPPAVRRVLIGRGVTLTGALRLTDGQTVEGEDRDSSVIYGTATKAWSRGPNGVQDPGTRCPQNGDNGAVAGDDLMHDCDKWRYGAISVVPGARNDKRYAVRNLTVENPRTYAITAFGPPMDLDRVVIKNTRPAPDFLSNSDGFGAGAGSTIRNSLIDTWDDSIKLYQPGMVVENVTIVHNLNGAPFQFGWSAHKPVDATLVNVKIVQAKGTEGQRFNLAPFSGSGGRVEPTVRLAGLAVHYAPGTTVNQAGVPRPMPLVFLKGDGSRLTLRAVQHEHHGPHLRLGVFDNSLLTGRDIHVDAEMDGKAWVPGLERGSPDLVTGCADCPTRP